MHPRPPSPAGLLGTLAGTQYRKPWEESIQVVCIQHTLVAFWWPRITSVYSGAVGPEIETSRRGEKTKQLASPGLLDSV